MRKKFKGKYRIDSVRLKSWDYSWAGYYFITICVKDRRQFLGKIVEGKMILSEMGKIVDQCWKEIPNHFENVMLDEFVVMSDHVHGIVFLERDAINRVSTSTSTSTSTTSTSMSKSTSTRGGITKNKNPMLFHNSLGKIIRWFKGRTTFEINKKYPYAGFQWQSLYYDHIIRDQRAFENIQQYICLNPQKWHDTRNFS